ncbi:DNA-directed RNA polymerase III subunit RPC8 [Enteropsectra breve]|nr:DNA-directed RNA polymerase III subunit RPC8 [Enteropsectra breve]
MHVISEIEDTVEIRAACSDKTAEALSQIKRKYIGKISEELGIGVHLCKMLADPIYEIHGEMLVATVRFQMVFWRFYYDEICVGEVVAQDEEMIRVADQRFGRYEAQCIDLFENSEYVSKGKTKGWVWNYKGNKLAVYNKERVTFRIKKLNFEQNTADIYMNESGCGPIVWWK